jgi:hypothetical protein
MKDRGRRKIANVAGRTVYIRHATAWDLDTIQNEKKAWGRHIPDLDPERVVVAAEEDAIIGFGIMGKPSAQGSVCITVFEKRTRRGIGSSIIRHMLENDPQISGLRASDDRSELSLRLSVPRRRSRSSANKGGASTACPVDGRSRSSVRRGSQR